MIGTSLKHSSFGNDKAHKVCISRTNTKRAYSWSSTDEPFMYQQMKWHLFPNGENNYNEKEFLLASIEVWNNKTPTKLELMECLHMYPILNHVYMNFNWLKSYMYGNTQRKTLKMQHCSPQGNFCMLL